MPNILDRMLDAATNRRYGQPASTMIREARAFRAVAQEEPWRFSPIGPTLRELDSETMDWLMNTLGYETIGYLGGKPTLTATENDRIACVKRIRHLYCYDVLVNRSVGVWTDYGFGEDVALTVTAEGESKEGECQALWDAFWTDPENEPIFGARHLQELSNQLLVDGELFMALFASKTAGSVIGDGKVIVRLVPTEQITELVAPPDDNATPGYFKRAYLDANGSQVTIYYPNLQASAARRKRARDLLPSGSRFAEDERPGTDVCMLQVPFKLINGRGWPLPSASYRWAEEYTQFLRDRAAINRAINAYTSKAKVKGGTRGVAAVKAAFASTIGQGTYGYETNPPAGAGSTLITNEAVDWQRLPMASGASDARVDGMALLSEYAAGVALPPFLLGRTDTMQNRATADTSLQPTLRAWNRYQTFWASIFTDLCNYVLDCAEQYGVRPVKYTGREIMVSLDSPLETDFYELTKAINESVGASTLRAQEASRILLERPELNIPNPSAVWDEMYGEAQAQSESETPEEEPNPEPAEELHREMLIQLAREAWFTAPSEEQRIAARIFTEENGAIVEGSASSGNFGHAGIPGHRGGQRVWRRI